MVWRRTRDDSLLESVVKCLRKFDAPQAAQIWFNTFRFCYCDWSLFYLEISFLKFLWPTHGQISIVILCRWIDEKMPPSNVSLVWINLEKSGHQTPTSCLSSENAISNPTVMRLSFGNTIRLLMDVPNGRQRAAIMAAPTGFDIIGCHTWGLPYFSCNLARSLCWTPHQTSINNI